MYYKYNNTKCQVVKYSHYVLNNVLIFQSYGNGSVQKP